MIQSPALNARRVLVLAFFAAALVAFWFHWSRRSARTESPRGSMTNALETVMQFEARAAGQYWAPELIAEKYGRLIDQLWDQINASTDKLEVVRSMPIQEVRLPDYSGARELPHGIELFLPAGRSRTLSEKSWRDFVQRQIGERWELAQCEFRHNAFRPGTNAPSSSTYYFSADLVNRRLDTRAILEGNLNLTWSGDPDEPALLRADATGIEVRARRGPAPFAEVLNEVVQPPEGSYLIDPLIVWDLDHDGTPEIILAAKNLVYHRQKAGAWSSAPLCAVSPGIIFSGILGDFTGDGVVDFLCAKFEGLFLYDGSSDGSFRDPPRQVWAAQPHLKYVQTLALGDVDGDGDLDLFLGQYKVPYLNGQLPFPYFDANDGSPSYLFLNDGKGNFTDGSRPAGLGAKRGRRVYSASLVDLDADGDLDLVLVSDFAGLDAFENDGSGHFTDVTAKWFGETHGFGMGLSFADFNRDGFLDVLMIGMNSPTADRLESLHLTRPYDRPDEGMREKVTYGNRLFFGNAAGTFHQNAVSALVARTGWSWGSAAADLDNDGFPDLYIVNGHESRRSVVDYEPEFWLHDIYIGNSRENSLAQLYFRKKFAATRGQGDSYGGYEKNRLFLNLGGTNFVEAAYLFGLGLQEDCRNVIADDLNGDGRLDLVLTTFSVYPQPRQTLRIFENRLPDAGRAAVLSLRDETKIGRSFKLETSSPEAAALVGGDSYRSQSRPRFQIGLGAGVPLRYDTGMLTRAPAK